MTSPSNEPNFKKQILWKLSTHDAVSSTEFPSAIVSNSEKPKLGTTSLPLASSHPVKPTEPNATPVGNYSPYHGVTPSNPFESPFHLIGGSPFHVATTESPYHVPSSTESPMHAHDESPMYIPTSLSECVLPVASLSEKEFERTQKVVAGESTKSHTHKRKMRKETAKISRKRRVVSGAVGSSRSQGQAKVVGRRVKGNSVCIESSIKGTGKASESDNCDSDYEYDTSDMENGECMKRRRFCVEQMDGLASHFHKFQERFCTDKLLRLDTNISKLKCGSCEQYLKQVSKETERLKSKVEHLSILNKYRRQAVKNTYQYHEFVAAQEVENEMSNIRMEVKTDLENRKKVLQELSSVDSEWSSKQWQSFKSILGETYPPAIVPILVRNGPVVVYQLNKEEIDRDLMKIRSLTTADSRNDRSLSTHFSNSAKIRQNRTAKKAGRKKYSTPKTVIFNNLTIKTSQRLCVEHPGSRNFYGYASEVDKNGALVIRGQSDSGHQGSKVSNGSPNVRVVTVQQIKNGEIYLHAA